MTSFLLEFCSIALRKHWLNGNEVLFNSLGFHSKRQNFPASFKKYLDDDWKFS